MYNPTGLEAGLPLALVWRGQPQWRIMPVPARAALARLLGAPAKPAVTLPVMARAQHSMLAPDLPFRSDV